ncbi:DUF998 domain-containing protein [Natronosalvus vescus]|uniref:DUF998 domain-containing protein n=1 Tax=Natronosalvus vescus TaxID=2953881 RepID=UPI0020900AB9|nr:DUF998 domain-containing protein [Natronosalvus vescus]
MIVIGTIVLATILASPETFTWRSRALSDLGRPAARTFWLFNVGLVVGGLIGIPFVRALWRTSRNTAERVGAVLTGVSLLGMIGVGIFFLEHTHYYLETDFHGVAALTVFGVAPFAQLLVGTDQILEGDRWLAIASVWLGMTHAVGWVAWLLTRAVADDPWHWFAVPEFVAALAFAVWIVLLTRYGFDRSRDSDRRATLDR